MMEAAQQGATEIAHDYLAEIATYFGALDLDTRFRCLPGSVLARDDLPARLAAAGFLTVPRPSSSGDD